MLELDYNQAWSFIASFAGDPNTAIIDFRAIHDTNKEIPAIPFRGTLPECWSSIVRYNSQQGYGMFAAISALDGQGRELANVQYIRAHIADLDNSSAQQNYERAAAAYPYPSFAVQSSPGKFHVYWPVQPYVGNDRFQIIQRKLRQLYDGDKSVIDATRVMRLPGSYHLKDPNTPHLVQCWALAGYGQWYDPSVLEIALASVNVIDGGIGVRHELGEPSLAAPSLAWLQRALDLSDPNSLDRGEWIAITSAIKQCGWSLTDEATLFAVWSAWCAKYTNGNGNDPGENLKQWNSIRNTELGWPSLLRRIPTLQAAISFGDRPTPQVPASAQPEPANGTFNGGTAAPPPMPSNDPPPLDCSGEYLTHLEQQEWFKECVFVINDGEMFTSDGRFLTAGQFNVAYGGKKFIIDTVGKTTNEAWQAATRSTLWTVPKVDHRRFVPHEGYRAILIDDLGRKGINTYKPINPRCVAGDASPFVHHIMRLLPDPRDQRILFDYLAHNARFPGHKIPWAPVIQSAEGAGKGVMKVVMKHVMGKPYVYFPKASELAKSGATFNAWMRDKLFILVDEIKVDEKRELIEILKDLISENEAEIQPKGVDQELLDNFSNWLFFTNWKDAIPVNKNSRRYAIMYSPFQTAADLILAGMNEAYFTQLYDWLDGDGAAIVANWLLNYPIERGAIPMRAPETSSSAEAVRMSRSPLERLIFEAVEDGLVGFRGGWISSIAIEQRGKATGKVRSTISAQAIASVVEGMGYAASGRANRAYFQEDKDARAYLFHFGGAADPAGYGRAQGYE